MLMTTQQHHDVIEQVRIERCAFAAKIRIARALLNWSQFDLASRTGLTQRAIHKLEQGGTEPRRATVRVLEEAFREEGLVFDSEAGGFRLTVGKDLLIRTGAPRVRARRPVATDFELTTVAPT